MKKEKISEKEYKKIYHSLYKKEYAIINFDEQSKHITLRISGTIKEEMASKNRLTKEDLEAIGFLLKPIYEKLDEHTKILNEHSQILEKHSQILEEHSQILEKHSRILEEHSQILNKHSDIFIRNNLK
ncbi:MAG: hypothetical protein ACRCRZ_01105 [Metamycoplasmataceae bacterium]